jgi:hypothetical protein
VRYGHYRGRLVAIGRQRVNGVNSEFLLAYYRKHRRLVWLLIGREVRISGLATQTIPPVQPAVCSLCFGD